MLIKHVGSKPVMTDIYYGTNLTWVGDQVHDVALDKAHFLLKHPDVWAAADPVEAVATLAEAPAADAGQDELPPSPSPEPPEAPPPAPIPETAPPAETAANPAADGLASRFSRIESAPGSLMDNDGGVEIKLNELDDDELKLWARTNRVKANFRLSGGALLAAVIEAAIKPME